MGWQVGFKDIKLIKKTKVESRVNAIVNRLNATKREEYPDLAAEREAYEKEVGWRSRISFHPCSFAIACSDQL